MRRSFETSLMLLALLTFSFSVSRSVAAPPPAGSKNEGSIFPAGWETRAPRDEIRPRFSFDPHGGPNLLGAFVIATSDSVGDHGWFQTSIPIVGGKFYRFHAVRKVEHVAAPFRSAVVRIVWQDSQGKEVLADVPANASTSSTHVPLAEPDHPLDEEESSDGWTTVVGTYRAPSKATQAIVELHLQWAPSGICRWSDFQFDEVTAPPARKVRLAAIHYAASGKSPRTNCEEYAPLIAKAAKQKADLVVLGETITTANIPQPPHELAEPVPGPTTQYFGELAKQHQIHIVVGLYERDDRTIYNVAALLGPDGKLIGRYRKVCLPHREIEWGVAPGNDYPVFETKFGKVGMMICYDGFFPEVARELTNRGAEVIAWPVAGCNPLLAKARACENHVYLISNTYCDSKSNWMISAVFNHAGEPIATADAIGDVAVVEVDLSERYFWRNNLGDFHAMVQRHRPPTAAVLESIRTVESKKELP